MPQSQRARRVAAKFQRRLVLAMTLNEAAAILGVSPGASKPEIHSAYKRLARKHHTDHGGSNETMVEINVAKDVMMKGKDIKYKKQETPESRQREADYKAMMQLREGLLPAANAARSDLSTVSSLRLKISLRDFILVDMADVCDEIEDVAEKVAADPQPSDLTIKRAKQISAAVKVVLASAVKLATKYGSLTKQPLGSGSFTYAEAEMVYKRVEKFVPALQSTYAESKKLTTLLNQLVGTLDDERAHPIPFDLVERYFECQEMIRSFALEYGAVRGSGLAKFENAMKATYEEASEILERNGLTDNVPKDWKQWRIPEDIDEVVDALRGLQRAASAAAPIYTDSKGKPIEKPERSDYKSDYEYARAFGDYKRELESLSSAAVYHKKRQRVRR